MSKRGEGDRKRMGREIKEKCVYEAESTSVSVCVCVCVDAHMHVHACTEGTVPQTTK